MVGWNHEGVFSKKPCKVCNTLFKPRCGAQRFCSITCKGKWKYISGRITTAAQYATISGNWARYFNRLRCRSGKRTAALPTTALLEIFKKQEGRCALTGAQMTCKLQKGERVWTNASIDRIVAGGPYTPDNVQLVCHAVNIFRGNMDLDQFRMWCRLVTEHGGKDAP